MTPLRANSFSLILVLAMALAVGEVGIDMILSSLPSLTDTFKTGTSRTQLTLSVYLVGFAFGQLVYGPVSDRYGRKTPLLVGTALFVAASIAAGFATSIEMLIIFRFIQSLGGAAGFVIALAVIRDLHDPDTAALMLARMGSVIGFAPGIAPILGGYLLLWFGWRANFFFLAAWGLVVIVIVAVWMPESNFRPDPTAMRPLQIFRNFRALLRNRSYLGHTLMMVFIFGAFFAFISGSPFVFIGILGIAPENFAPITLTITVLGFVMGTLLANNFSQHFGIERVLFAAVMLSAASGVVTAILPWLGVQSVASIIGPLAIFAFAAGFIFPLATAAAIGPFPHMAGAAASLLGFLESTVGATLGVLVGILHDGTVFPMTLVIGASTTTSFVVYLVFLWRRPIRPTDQLRSAQESNLRPPD
jgi:DHA1 family bicyclomycin/chloramphenicol resistance-like MFS transporter